MNTVKVLFANSANNYTTSINGTAQEVKAYFVGKKFNLGYMGWDHDNDCEIEVDNMQTCIGVEFIAA